MRHRPATAGRIARTPVFALSLLWSIAASAETLRLPATRDNSIVLHPAELNLNAGASPRIRIKGNQHIVAMGFDLSSLRGRAVRSATLICAQGDAEISGVTISTIQAEWDEMRSTALTSGAGPEKGWGVPGASFPSVSGGYGESLVCHARAASRGGRYEWPIDPDIVSAMAIGASFGLAIHEHDADYSRNPTIQSRESRESPPYLEVDLGPPEPSPGPPTDLRVTDRGDPDSLRLCLVAPANGFAYEVSVNGAPLPRWNTPFVRPREHQSIPIRDVPIRPGATIRIDVVTVNREGERSAPATIIAAAPNTPPPPLPKVAPCPARHRLPEATPILPLEDRLDAKGQPIGNLPPGWLDSNEATGADGSVSLSAARGEVVGFQVLLRGEGVVIPKCEIPGARVDLHRALFVESDAGRIPDPLVPAESIRLSPDEPVPLVADIYVPFDTPSKDLRGTLSISAGHEIPVKVHIREFALPRRASFLCEMNSYGMPDQVSEFYALQRVAYDHRTHCNLLHYGHGSAAPGARKCNLDMRLPDGRRMDERRHNDFAPGAKRAHWDDFVAAFGPYLTGECFRDGHRGPIPAPGFYLTFHESWPLHIRAHFNGNPDAFEAFKAEPLYAQTFKDVLRDFLRIADEHRWRETGFQIYFNNKGDLDDPKRCPWVLDEPASFWDYRALAYYADLVRGAKADGPPIRAEFRIDISRPEFDRGLLLGKADLWVVSGQAFAQYHRVVMDRSETTGERIWVYGAAVPAHQSSRAIMAWAISAYRDGASGLVPWQTINRDGSALRKADPLGILIVDRQQDGTSAIRATFRLKAFRRAQQDIEYLELARKKLRWTGGQLRAFVDHYLPLRGTVEKKDETDAGTSSFDALDPENFRALREAAAMLIESHPNP